LVSERRDGSLPPRRHRERKGRELDEEIFGAAGLEEKRKKEEEGMTCHPAKGEKGFLSKRKNGDSDFCDEDHVPLRGSLLLISSKRDISA